MDDVHNQNNLVQEEVSQLVPHEGEEQALQTKMAATELILEESHLPSTDLVSTSPAVIEEEK